MFYESYHLLQISDTVRTLENGFSYGFVTRLWESHIFLVAYNIINVLPSWWHAEVVVLLRELTFVLC